LVLGLVLSACAQGPSGDAAPAGDGLGGASALRSTFRAAEAASGVPAEILATVSYAETRLRNVSGWAHDGHGAALAVGLMALAETGVRSAERAAELAGVSLDDVYLDPQANVLAAAALLADLAGPELPRDRAGWRAALVAYGDAVFADEIARRLAAGWQGTDATGAALTLTARPLGEVPGDGDGDIGRVQRGLGYDGAIWNAAYGGNFAAGSRGAAQINYVVIHTVQGSYGGAISWFKNPDANVSSHYVVRSSDGELTQMVDDSDVAWHDACFNSESIGIEHEGFVQDPSAWYTEALYTRSAQLTAWLADAYDIPLDRTHILGHGEAPDCSDHTDPGTGWDWPHYMELVENGGAPRYGAAAMQQDTPTQMVSGEQRDVWYEFQNDSNVTWGLDETRLGTAEPQDRESAFFVDGNWLSPSRATGADHSTYTPGSVGRFSFTIRAPEVTEPTTFVESFQLVQEGEAWFGPVVTMTVEVMPSDGADDVGGEGDDTDDEATDDAREGDVAGGCAAGGGTGQSGAGCAILLLGALLVTGARRARRRR
jgi:hypothetical protein